MLLRQNGLKEDGWRDTPFYWPVLIVPKNIKKVVYALDGAVFTDKEIITPDGLGVDPEGENVLRLTLGSGPFWGILFGEKDGEYRDINKNTASRYIEQSPTSPVKYKIREDIPIDTSKITGIESYNGGIFPFVLRKFDYILFRNSRDNSGSLLLVKLKPYTNDSIIGCSPKSDIDKLADINNNVTPFNEKTLCDWSLTYQIESVVGFKLNKADTKRYEEMKKEYLVEQQIKPEDIDIIESKQVEKKINSMSNNQNNLTEEDLEDARIEQELREHNKKVKVLDVPPTTDELDDPFKMVVDGIYWIEAKKGYLLSGTIEGGFISPDERVKLSNGMKAKVKEIDGENSEWAGAGDKVGILLLDIKKGALDGVENLIVTEDY